MYFWRIACLTAVLSLSGWAATAQAAGPRQFYGEWEKTAKHFFHRDYYFKATPTSPVEVHKVIWFPEKPQYYYYWNAEKRVFWGRGLVFSTFTCEPQYQFLQPPDRKAELKDIPEKAFGKVTAPPKLSEVAGLDKVNPVTDERLKLPIDGPPLPFTQAAN